MRYLYWALVAAVLAVAVHIVVLIFVPGMVFERSLNTFSADIPNNQFFLLKADAQRKIFPDYPGNSVFGLCRFDLTAGPVALNANLPDTFWTLTVYSKTGKTLYTVNNQQSGTNSFKLELIRAPGLIESLSAAPEEDLIASSGWKVRSSDTKGFALFWVPSNDPAMRQGLGETMAKSTCRQTSG
jgi:uncharacterized membrane protein